MLPKRTMTATIEISTGTLTITSVPPTFMGEICACCVQIDLYNEGTAYSPANAVAEMYLYWPGPQQMTVATEMAISGSRLTANMTDAMMARAGSPLLVIQLTDIATGDLIIAAAAPISIFETRGGMVLDSRAPSPSEIVYIGRSPYVDTTTKHWMEWDTESGTYVDTGVFAAGKSPYVNSSTGTWMVWDPDTEAYIDTDIIARGTPATFSAAATTLPAGSAATASISGSPENPVLTLGIPQGAKGNTGDTGAAAGFGNPTATVDANIGTPSIEVTSSGPDTAKVFNFAFHNIKGQKGDTGAPGAVQTVCGVAPDGTGNVPVQDSNIPCAEVTGQTTVEGAIASLNSQIANLGATCWEVVVEDNQFVLNWYGATAESPITLALEGADYVAYIND